MDIRDNRKCLQDIKTSQNIFARRRFRSNRRQGCLHHLTEDVLKDIPLNHQNSYLFSLHQKK